MRSDTTFLDRKLSVEQFSKKYWLNGDAPYQYHTVEIEDGRDEREQLIINNIRALWGRDKFHAKYNEQAHTSIREKTKKVTVLAVTSAVIGLIVFCITVRAYLK